MVLTNKGNDNGVMEFEYRRPENRTKWESFRKAIYDPQTKQCLGRTPKNWGQLLLFYTIFYAVLAALCAVCMMGLFASLDDKEPRWKLDSSLIGTNPGLGFRPIATATEEGALIWYNLTDPSTTDKWVTLVDDFLEPYNANQTGGNLVPCNFNSTVPPNMVCTASTDQLGQCNRERKYGYSTSSPCIFLKLNRIYGWKPEFYTSPVADMPPDLKQHILSKPESERKQIWVHCEGLNDSDQEYVQGFNYYPHGFAGYYYPYMNIDNYLSPIVAVEIVNVRPNIIVGIKCRAWAGNIKYDGSIKNPSGYISFFVQVDTEVPIVKTTAANSTI